jgi:hypothetical protein
MIQRGGKKAQGSQARSYSCLVDSLAYCYSLCSLQDLAAIDRWIGFLQLKNLR